MHDIVVVGAGPAGSSFALFAARQGFDVAVLDVNGFKGLWSKPCGDAISRETFRNVPLKEPSGPEVKQKVKTVEVFSPDYSFSSRLDGKGFIVDRTEFGQRILREAMKEGAQFFEHTAFRKVLLEDGRVTGVLASDGTRTKEFRAGLVVECTGDTAVVKSQLPAEWPVAEPVRDRALCYRGILEVGEVEEPTTIRMYTDQEVAPNCYWWFFPEGDHRANVGLGVLPRDAGMLRRSYTEIVSRFDVRATVQEAGAYVPVQRPPVSLVGPGVLVLGDAAPTVSPISGGGLESTMEASYEASKHLEEAAAGGWSLEACWPMNEYLRRGGARLAVEDVVKHAMWEGGTGFIDRGLKFLRGGLGLARLLVDADLRGVAMRARKAKKHFESYPKSPRDVKKWAAGLDPVHSPNF